MILYEDGNVLLSSTQIDGITFIHVEMSELKKDQYKKYLQEFSRVLKENKLEKVYSLVDNEKSKKLNQMFGFKELIPQDGYTIMEYMQWL